jgi:hypothetical protein
MGGASNAFMPDSCDGHDEGINPWSVALVAAFMPQPSVMRKIRDDGPIPKRELPNMIKKLYEDHMRHIGIEAAEPSYKHGSRGTEVSLEYSKAYDSLRSGYQKIEEIVESTITGFLSREIIELKAASTSWAPTGRSWPAAAKEKFLRSDEHPVRPYSVPFLPSHHVFARHLRYAYRH